MDCCRKLHEHCSSGSGLRTCSPHSACARLRPLCVVASSGRNASASTTSKLRSLSARPKRALGQNFCISDAVLEAIVTTAGIEAGDRVLEIGPGTGNLTRHILRHNPSLVTAIEKDDVLAANLAQEFREDTRLRLVHADALDADLARLTALGPVKVVANVPFNITTELLKMLLPLPNVTSVNLMLQAEAAVRLTSTAAGDSAYRASAYRAISLFIEYYSTPTYCFTIDRKHFLPPPGVDAALAWFVIKPTEERLAMRSEKALFSFLNVCFHMRRKTLLNNLKASFDAQRVCEALTRMDIPLSVRAQALDLAQLVLLHNHLADESAGSC